MGKEVSTKQEKVFSHVKEFLETKKDGARYSNIIKYLKEKLPDIPENTLHGSLVKLKEKIIKGEEKKIIIPEKGLYILSKYYQKETSEQEKSQKCKEEEEEEKKSQKPKEEDFYKSFADYLVNELEECTKAIALGGSKFQDKWGTPDVFGIYKFSDIDPVRPPLEIISAEIKTNTSQLITA
ncbi:MAG: hypothetical protein QXH07_06420, partial [Thermoplasmata archaeon]